MAESILADDTRKKLEEAKWQTKVEGYQEIK
jgi:hypothetical protein